MLFDTLPNADDWAIASRKRNVKLYGFYRLAIASALLFSQGLSALNHTENNHQVIINTLVVYFIFSCVSAFLSLTTRYTFSLSLLVQTCIDIGFIILMMHFYHDNASGVGLLLIISIVFASLISEGRYAIFYASLASIGLLIEETYNIYWLNEPEYYTNAVMLGLSCFATAWLAHTLAQRMQKSERLASERQVDLLNLAKINALITQEMPNGVLVISDHQQLKHFNHQFTQLTGLSQETLADAIKQQTPLVKLAPALSSLLDVWTNADQNAMQKTVSKLAMSNRDLGIRFLPVSSNRQDGAVIFVEDWSQVQTQAHQVKLAALGRLTANIAHEIRNPLSAISHANQLLQEDNDDPLTKRMLNIITDNVERLDQIIKDVLELNRRDRTNQEIIPLNAFILEFYHQFCAVEKIEPSSFKLVLDENDANILFDRRHINQIMWNLCKNGWRHCQKKENSLILSIKSHRNNDFILTSITDDGSGIDESIQSSLFEPFITTEKSGTGLGLYIAKELSEANGAKLDFSSASTGTQFTLVIKNGN